MKKTKLFIWFTIGLGLISAPSFAQTSAYTLQQCIDYAIKNHLTIQAAQYDSRIATARKKEVQGQGLPQVTANLQMSHSDPLRRMFMPNGTFINDPSKPAGAPINSPNFFQLPSSGDANLSASQLVFSGAYIVGLQGAKVYQQLADQTVLKTKIDVVEAVTKAYWMSVVLAERKQILDVTIARLDTSLRESKASNKSGFVESIDVSRLEVTYNNTLAERQKIITLSEISLIALKFRMGMPLDEELVPAEKLQDAAQQYIGADTSTTVNYESRIEYQQTKSNLILNKSERKLHISEGLPTLSLFGNFGVFNQTVKFNYFTEANPWYNYNTIGFNLTAPIITGGARHYKVQQDNLKIKKTEANMKLLEQSISFEVRNAQATYSNALKTVEINNKSLALAQQVVKVTNAKYKAGVGSNLELTVAESGLKEAQANYYIAVSDALLAHIDLDKAKGVLYNVK